MAAPDAIIVGGGHNGLVAAAYLAKAGAKVTVLERRPLVGGAAVTEELHPGFRFSRAAYAAGLLRPGIVHDLDLKRYGYEAFVKEPGSFVPFPDGKYLFTYYDARKTAEEFARFSKHDAKSYATWSTMWEGFVDLMEPILLNPPPDLDGLWLHFEKHRQGELLRRLLSGSAEALLSEYFESEYTKAAICGNAVIGTMVGPKDAGSAYVFAHHMLGVIDGRRNVWGFVKGGMGAISQALAAAARDLGVEVRVDTDVERIVIEDGRAVGVRLHGGNFLALPGKAVGPQHRCTIDVASMLDHLERAFDDAKYGDMSREPFLEMYLQSAVDSEMAPPGKHTMTLFTQYTPYHLRNGTWEGRREEWWGRVLDALDAYCPNVRDAVLWKEVLTPPDLERVFGLTGGNIFHGEITPDQMFGFRPAKGWAGYRTPIAGLYLCGSGAHPAGGVLGAPGRNAALVALEDLHRRNTFKRTGA
ncbi:MAG: NAD(P)/FAD-dependent oxidoreductase [Methanobacteriota archaeon]|nr:MAG: NAD(P)/FAD-dependent oxidoreductase [Euryarchaeota archaeon]